MNQMTAKVSCFARAYHTEHSAEPVFSDPAAKPLLGADYEQIAQSMTQGVGFFLPGFDGSPEEGLRRIVEEQLAPSVLARSAFCEAALEQEAREGCSQYLLLASGYDTWAIRHPGSSFTVFELDLPEMIEDKRTRIAAAGLSSEAIYVPCDLSDPSWADTLRAHGFWDDRPAFCSLLGISYYLSTEEFRTLLKTLGGLLCERSCLCFDYPLKGDSRQAETNRALASGAGEAMKARYSEPELEALLSNNGFSIREHRTDDLRGVGYVLAALHAA